MFKRLDKKRKRREEEEELGLDQDLLGTFTLNNTDSDESDSDLDRESAQSDPDAGTGEDEDQGEDAASENEGVSGDPPMSVAEALKDPIYLVSLDPTIHGCVLCKGKLIKNTGIAVAHRNANAHKRRFEHLRRLSAGVDPHSDARELVRAIHSASNERKAEPQGLSKRALKRQVRQAKMRGKRQHHRELKVKAIAKKALKNSSTVDETRPAAPPTMDLRSSAEKPGKTQKRKKLESNTPANIITESRDVTAKSTSLIKNSGDRKKLVLISRLKNTRKATRHHKIVTTG